MPTEDPAAATEDHATFDEAAVGEVVAAFMAEAVGNGWFTVGETNDAVPPHLRDLFPGHARLGLTLEGRQRLAAALAAAGVANADEVAAQFEPPNSRL